MSSVNTTTINTICKNANCEYDISQFPATVEVDREHQSLYCLVCGSEIERIRNISDKDIFYDPDSRIYYKWISTAQATAQPDLIEHIQIGSLAIRIPVKAFDYRKLFYDAVLVFIRDDNHAAYVNELIDNETCVPPESYKRYGVEVVSASMQSNGNYLDVKFRLKGSSNDFFIVLPAATTKPVPNQNIDLTNSSVLKVWPDFKRPATGTSFDKEPYSGWADYFVYFDTKDASITPESIRVVGENPGDEVRITGKHPKSPIKAELNFPPEYIEISARVSTPGNPAKLHKACFKVKLHTYEIGGRDKPLRLSVDFGTSNTCFGYKLPNQQEEGQWDDPKALSLNNRSRILIDGIQTGDDLANTWLPNLNDQKLIPSELVFFETPVNAVKKSGSLLPIVDYTIPTLKWRKDEAGFISTGFKWRQATEPRDIADSYQTLQKMYLGIVFRLALAELVSDVLKNTSIHPYKIDLYITFPLSMSEEERENLQESYQAVKEEIHKVTGIEIQMKGYVDESYAAEKGASTGGALDESHHRIYIDVGGGTTDISVVELQSSEKEDRKAQIGDSVRYAGNDFLMALANDDPASVNQQSASNRSKENTRRGGKISSKSLVELQRRIRAEKGGVLEELSTFGGNKAHQDTALIALERFLDGLIQYIARIAAWKMNDLFEKLGENARDQKLDIHLLGNGWRFLLFLPRRTRNKKEDITKIVIGEVEGRLREVLSKFEEEKLISLKLTFKLYHSYDPKIVVAMGALEPGTTSGAINDKKSDSILGSDVVIEVSGKKQIHGWQEKVPLQFDDDSKVTGVRIKALSGFEQDIVPDYKHDDAPMTGLQHINILNHVYKEDEGQIVKNVFNVYLERWHKRFLHPKGWF